ncbi:multiple pdz domain protein [Plakobranchus ocellatus]|uniref:Multiple pdz domain protein n=1 Tax=Plakobranchus ocellatus TaxID=259542 RepID=A0AAV4BFZ5_9GAST|nr:multiple pdz domain protein [Plakobranchus ocellatus]
MTSLTSDTETAAKYVEILQQKLQGKGDHSQDDTLTSIMCMLESPIFRRLLTLQESLEEIKHISRTQPLTDEAFAFTSSGELVLNDSSDAFLPENVADSSTLKLRGQPFDAGVPAASLGYAPEVEESIKHSAAGRSIHIIDLEKPENRSLGFSVVGLGRDDASSKFGIFVKEIQPGGIAAIPECFAIKACLGERCTSLCLTNGPLLPVDLRLGGARGLAGADGLSKQGFLLSSGSGYSDTV